MYMNDFAFWALVIFFFAGVFLMVLFAYKKGRELGRARAELKWEESLQRLRREIAEKQRVGIKGKISEAFAPYLKDFPFKASECKFIGDPIDYVVFEGLDDRDVKRIVLVEIKSGKSALSKHQKQIQEIIGGKKVDFYLYRFND